MFRYRLTIGLMVLQLALFAQENTKDSLLVELERADEDSLKIEILLRLFNPTVVNDLDEAYEYTDRAHKLSESIGFDKGIAAAYQRKGIIWNYRGNVTKARTNYQKAIQVHERLDHETVAATLIYNLGLLYQEQGLYDSALIFNQRAADVFLKNDDSLKYASCLDLFATIHHEKGNYYLSLNYAIAAEELFDRYGDELREADVLVKIGQGYDVQGNYADAIRYYNEAIDLYRKHNDRHWENFTLQKIVLTYLKQGRLDMAESLIDRSVLLSDSLSAAQMLSEGLDIKGDIFFRKGDYNQALELYDQALVSNKEAIDSAFIAMVTVSKARCYQQLGQPEQALVHYRYALPMSQKMDIKENLKIIYENLSKLYEARGQTALAYASYKKYDAVKDTLYQSEKSRQFADMQTKYDTERKEDEIAMQDQQITILEQRVKIQDLLRARLVVTIITMTAFFLLAIYALWQRTKKRRLKQQMENQRLSYELDLKKRELTTHTLHIIQKNELLETLQHKVSDLRKQDLNSGSTYKEITRLINTNRLADRDWENFKSVFEQVHPDFFAKLNLLNASISPNEYRMAAMMKMNLTTKEMAAILNITPEGVKKARYRLRKKFDLESASNVQEYLMAL